MTFIYVLKTINITFFHFYQYFTATTGYCVAIFFR